MYVQTNNVLLEIIHSLLFGVDCIFSNYDFCRYGFFPDYNCFKNYPRFVSGVILWHFTSIVAQ